MGNILNSLIFRPPTPRYSLEAAGLHFINTTHGSILCGYFIDNQADLTILFSHGNGEDIGDIVPQYEKITKRWNVNLFAYDYSGYGHSTGSPSEENIYRDAEAAYAYMRRNLKIPRNKIIAYGRSLGSAPSVHIAVQNEILGVVLQSPLASIYRVKFRLKRTMPYDTFCNIDKVHMIKSPILFIHGTNDKLISYKGTEEMLYKTKVNTYYMFIEKGGHNNLESSFGDKVNDALIIFLFVLKNNIKERVNRVYNISNIDEDKIKSFFTPHKSNKNKVQEIMSSKLEKRNTRYQSIKCEIDDNEYDYTNYILRPSSSFTPFTAVNFQPMNNLYFGGRSPNGTRYMKTLTYNTSDYTVTKILPMNFYDVESKIKISKTHIPLEPSVSKVNIMTFSNSNEFKGKPKKCSTTICKIGVEKKNIQKKKIMVHPVDNIRGTVREEKVRGKKVSVLKKTNLTTPTVHKKSSFNGDTNNVVTIDRVFSGASVTKGLNNAGKKCVKKSRELERTKGMDTSVKSVNSATRLTFPNANEPLALEVTVSNAIGRKEAVKENKKDVCLVTNDTLLGNNISSDMLHKHDTCLKTKENSRNVTYGSGSNNSIISSNEKEYIHKKKGSNFVRNGKLQDVNERNNMETHLIKIEKTLVSNNISSGFHMK